MITERDRAIWRAALTLANNLCVQQSDRHNNDDEINEARAASECAERVRAWIDATDDRLCDIFSEGGVDGAAPKIKPLVWNDVSSIHSFCDLLGGRIFLLSHQNVHSKTGLSWFFDCPDGVRIDDEQYDTIQEAKAAAQAWYESKIRECLE